MKKLLIIALVAMLFQSCDKAAQSTTATVSTANNTDDPYKLELNASTVGTCYAHQSQTFTKSPGDYSYKLTQMSGYVLYPTTYAGNFTLDAGKDIQLSFP